MSEDIKPKTSKKKKVLLIAIMLVVMTIGIMIILDAKSNAVLDPSLFIPCDELVMSNDGNFVNCKANTPTP